MNRIGWRGTAILVTIALGLSACGKSIQPTNGPDPFRGEFPAPYDGAYGGPPPPDPYYGEPPPYAGEPAYGYDERTYAAPEDYHWYTAHEYRESRGYGGYEYREHGPVKPHAEYREESGHELRYMYKYRLKDRVIKLDHPHFERVIVSGGLAAPVPHEYSYVEKIIEKPKVIYIERPPKIIYVKKPKVKVKKVRRSKTCICRYEKQAEDFRGRMHDSRITVEGFDKGYRLEMPADILFALDSDVIKTEAPALIRNVAGGLIGERGAEIDVNGYADTSGSEEHNDLLSQSRAVAVADALASEGVGPARINPRGFGESVLRVPTPDGVREPLNRRVEIVVLPNQNNPSS